MSNFIQLCLEGDRMLDEIDDAVDDWHDGDTGVALHDFLGMSRDEYSLWVLNPDVLPLIVTSRRTGKTVSQQIEEFEQMPLAARSFNDKSTQELCRWLNAQGHMV